MPSPPSRPPVPSQDYFHYGLIPAIIVIGMTTTPPPQPLPAPHPRVSGEDGTDLSGGVLGAEAVWTRRV